MIQFYKGIKIEAISACVPKSIVNNDKFLNIYDHKGIKKLEKTTGIIERRYVIQNQTAGDLGYYAAADVLSNNNSKLDIGFLIFVSQTSDYKIPFTSNIIQQRLNLNREILCLDLNAGCAGFIQGLSLAFSLANSNSKKVLLIVAESLSKILSEKDKTTAPLFGDGASALIIGKDEKSEIESNFNSFSDGGNHDAIIIPDGGYRNPFNSQSLNWKRYENDNFLKGVHLHMNGQKVFDFTLREIPASVEKLFFESNLKSENIDYFLFHQSNKFILNQLGGRLKIPNQKILMNIDRFGNTSSVSIPLLMVTELKGKIQRSNKILMSGYGSGLNWGNCIIDVDTSISINHLVEI